MIFSRVAGIVAVAAVTIFGQAQAEFPNASRARGQGCGRHVECATGECREQICIGNTGRNRMPNPKKLGAKCQTDDDCKSNRCSPNTKTCMCQICRGSGCGDCGKHFQCFEPWYKGLDNRCDRAPKWYGEYCSKNIDCISQNCYIDYDNWTESYCDCTVCSKPGCSGKEECGQYGENASCRVDGREWWPNKCQYHAPTPKPSKPPVRAPRRRNAALCAVSSDCESGACFKTKVQQRSRAKGLCHCNPKRRTNTCADGFYCKNTGAGKKNQCLKKRGPLRGTGSPCKDNSQCASKSCFRTGQQRSLDTTGVCECMSYLNCGAGRKCARSNTNEVNRCEIRRVGEICKTSEMCGSGSCYKRTGANSGKCQCKAGSSKDCDTGFTCRVNNVSRDHTPNVCRRD
uniref:EGF-like domain-containing protein n=1 Tax=Corethron hystrix TaxID=216773 RepID=A0A6U5KSL4_9STRA|mmetsp:Transcript_41798/g.97875  ORF Transcript_41798/g.97875 Transcript_41798/m.97875 type:complete len:400 (+) Transcript_41798:116-1315(+)